MGEVYLAQDQTLERNVALKILPPELVRSEDRVRRFVREAKSASSLNHPNIVTIYEIGEDAVRGGDGVSAPGSSAVHYISMELVSGETLSTKIHQDKTDLRTLLGYLAQAAEGLAKAHAAGIVHRDLKPGNIMVSKDGFAKVLDFGLAKLTETGASEGDATMGATEAGDATNPGAIVGTAGYMAPEQVRGGAVDHRADIFSFGCILYEAATRKKPFTADSNVETMHKILHEKPVPVEDINKNVPSELRRLIRRCLAKNPDQRLQSAKDLAIELREIVDEYDSLTASGSSGSASSATAAVTATRRKISTATWVLGAALVAGIVIAGVLVQRGRDTTTEVTTPALRVSAITNRGLMNGAAISPDGRYVAYSMYLDGVRTLWVHQVATGSDVQILSAQKVSPAGLIFAPGGDYLYYQSADPDRDGYTAIFEIPTLGGTPKKRAYDVDSRITFSPDGKKIAFRRGMPQKNQDALVVMELSSGKEQILATASPPVYFGQPDWSPDGKRIAMVENRGGVALGSTVASYRVGDGKREPIGTAAFYQMDDLVWLPDGSGLIASAFDLGTMTAGQLWRIGFPDGRATHMTSDGSFYAAMTLSADGKAIAAVRGRQEFDLWVANPNGARGAHQATFGSEVRDFDQGPDSTLLYCAVKDGTFQIFAAAPNGASERSLTEGEKGAFSPRFCEGAGIVYVHAGDDLIPHIWRMDADGENPRAVTSGSGEQIGDVSRDGHLILFYPTNTRDVLWKVTSGGQPVRLGASTFQSSYLSPSGDRVLHTLVHEIQGAGAFSQQIIYLNNDKPPVIVDFPPRSIDPQWTVDGRAISYLNNSNDRRNVFLLPLDGGAPREITRFTEGRISHQRWSPDGKHLVVVRRSGDADNLWIVAPDGSNPVQLTQFPTGAIGDIRWSRDGSQIYFTYGPASQSVVLIRNFSGRG